MVTESFFSLSLAALNLTSPCAPDSLRHSLKSRAVTLSSCASLHGEEAQLCHKGEKLFFDKTLSFDGKVSCASCHNFEAGATRMLFTDGKSRPQTRGTTLESPRTMSLLDVGRTTGPYFWNGRAETLEAQNFWPLYGKHELGATQLTLKSHGGAEYVSKALAQYMKTLNTGPAPFDKWLEGDCKAMSNAETRGALLVLQKKNCTTCHTGTEFRGKKIEVLRYPWLPEFAQRSFAGKFSERVEFSALPGHGGVALKSVAPSLRNLEAKGTVYGRFGAHMDLRKFLRAHGTQPTDVTQRFSLSVNEENDVVAFLMRGLLSTDLKNVK